MNNNEICSLEEMTYVLSVETGKKYVVGAGIYGDFIGKYFNEKNVDWTGYVDKKGHSYKGRENLNGKPIVKYDDISSEEQVVYFASSVEYGQSMKKTLIEMGIDEDRIYTFGDVKVTLDMYNEVTGYRSYTEKLKRYNNIHKGESVFIIGNGPSLRIEDLERLKGKTTFASNSIYALYDHTEWRPTYYSAHDENFCQSVMSDKNKMLMLADNCEELFTTVACEGFDYREDKDFNNLNYYMFEPGYRKEGSLFSTDISDSVYYSGTITYINIQIAYYMGFDKIYLLGMDCNYADVQDENGNRHHVDVKNYNRFIEAEENKTLINYLNEVPMLYKQLAAYEGTRIFAEEHGMKVYNATRGGKLEAFERVDFDSLF